MNIPAILALDASSTMIGYCLYHRTVIASGEIGLKDPDIAVRCRLAYAQFNGLLATLPRRPDVIAIESPVARFASAVIPQARVSGALMVAASLQELLVLEVAPQLAKRALAGKGNASKEEMQFEAWQRYGIKGEHAADAVGIAIAAVGMVKVEREAA